MARLKLVPWEPTWLSHQTLDLHAIYRRPVRDPATWEIMRDESGFVRWDLTCPLPIRNHVAFRQKGFEYVTLATTEDVRKAASPMIAEKGATPLGGQGRPVNEHPDDYVRQPGIRGPFSVPVYFADMADEHAERRARISQNIAKYGRDGAEAFERERDPGYRLPETFGVTQEPKRRGRPRGSRKKPALEQVAV